MTKWLTPEQKKEVLRDLRETNLTLAMLAEKHGVGVKQVWGVARPHNLRPHKGQLRKRDHKIKGQDPAAILMREALARFTMVELAYRTGYDRDHLMRIRDGSRNLGLGAFFAIAQVLGYEVKLEKL